MFYISKTFSFEAAHHLDKLPPEHKCSRQHGHSYTVEVVLKASSLQEDVSWIIDYADVSKVVNERIISKVDHRDLNEIFFSHTTAEMLANWFYRALEVEFPEGIELAWVKVSETDKTWAIFSEEEIHAF